MIVSFDFDVPDTFLKKIYSEESFIVVYA